MTGKNFLRTLLLAASIAAAGFVSNGCAALNKTTLEEKLKYDSVAHDILDIEGEFGTTFFDYRDLDDIIDEARERINKIKLDKPFTEYTEKEAVTVLETIDEILKDKGFKYQGNDLLNQGLKTKKIDCDNYSVIYLGIADVLRLPLKAVNVPEHVFIRWHFTEDKYINWETIGGEKFSDRSCKLIYNISNVSIENGVFLKSLSRKEVYSKAYINRGLTLSILGKHEEAIKNFDKVLELHPNNPLVYNNKGVTLGDLKRYEEAIENYDSAIKLNPNHSLAYYNKGVALRKLEKHEEAIENYDKAIELNPKDYDFHIGKGIALSNLGRYEEAIESCNKAIAVNPDDPRSYNNKGVALDDLERYEEAIENYGKALELDPNYTYALENRGIAIRKILLKNMKEMNELLLEE